MVTNIEL